MRTINIRDAKTHLSRLGPLKAARKPRRLGVLAGRFTVPDDFDAPLPEDALADFERRG